MSFHRLLLLLLACTAAACATSGAVPRPFPSPMRTARPASDPTTGGAATRRPPSPVSPAPAESVTSAIVGSALELRGSPYLNGGQDVRGFDCSGLVWYVFARNGIGVPRTVAEQYRAGRPVQPMDLRPGDLVFFDTNERSASHVGVAIGGDGFVHAPSTRGEVRVERLATPYWAKHYLGARRLL